MLPPKLTGPPVKAEPPNGTVILFNPFGWHHKNKALFIPIGQRALFAFYYKGVWCPLDDFLIHFRIVRWDDKRRMQLQEVEQLWQDRNRLTLEIKGDIERNDLDSYFTRPALK
jgi:hypothetical protein